MVLIKVNILWSNLTYVNARVDHFDQAQFCQSDHGKNFGRAMLGLLKVKISLGGAQTCSEWSNPDASTFL